VKYFPVITSMNLETKHKL